MFFAQDELNARILDVVELNQGSSDTLNKRGYHALSLRLEADTRLTFSDQTVYAGSGAIGYFPANLSYRRQSVRDQMIVIHFDLTDYYSGAIEIVNLRDPSQIQALFEEALAVWKKQEPGYYYHTASCFYRILSLLRKESTSQRPVELPSQIYSAITYLDTHFTQASLSVAELAEHCGVSQAYFRRLFRSAVGQSPRQYLIGKRISHAISLLDSGVLSVAQVAEQSGFSDPKYFSTVFREVVGCSPRDYLYHWNLPNPEDNL